MKVNVELQLDYLDEEDPDEYIARKIVENIVGNVDEKIKTTIRNHIDTILIEKVNSTIDSIMAEFLERNIVVTDRYGDEVSRYESTRELLKERFDNFVTESVDSKGAPVKDQKGCYVNGKPRINYLIEKMITEKTGEFQSFVAKEAQSSIAAAINSAKASVKKDITDKYITIIEAGIKAQGAK